MSSQEQRELRTNEAFTSFLGLNPLQYNPYTQPLWNAAVAQYDRVMAPVEQKIAGKLRQQLKGMEGYPQQVSSMYMCIYIVMVYFYTVKVTVKHFMVILFHWIIFYIL